MSQKESKTLIIDASVARAAGTLAIGPDTPETKKKCRAFLDNVYEICHKIGWTEAIKNEWKKHETESSLLWLASMQDRGKLKVITSRKNMAFRKKVASAKLGKQVQEAVEKDIILIEAAWSSDKTIVSLDDKAKNNFASFCAQEKGLSDICWVNPSNKTEKPIEWLENGALKEKERLLGYNRSIQKQIRKRK
ncbi:MAG TPA: hypothetical protein PKH33_06225 [bacterium]|nr:hypothetical protein [bacterium]